MQCAVCQKLLDEYLDGSLTAEIQNAVQEHMDGCDFCQKVLFQLQKVATSITGMLRDSANLLKTGPEFQGRVFDALNELPGSASYQAMMGLFEELTLREKFKKMLAGLKEPKESGAYKWARLELTRLWSWVSAVVVPVVVLLLIAFFAAFAPARARVINVKILEPPPEEKLEELEVIEEEFMEMPEPIEMEFNELANNPHDVMMEDAEINPPDDFAPQPAKFDSVSIVRSPVTMRGIYGSRSPGSRGRARGLYGGSNATEGAVLRALRWLKKHQESDGRWTLMSGGGSGECKNTKVTDGAPAGVTGLALLTFLAHGETPSSPEFGRTLQNAIKWLVENQLDDGSYASKDGRKNYSHIIAAYALSEAFGMTKIPEIKSAAEKAIDYLLRGQHATGCWNYGFDQSNRDDTTFTAWCAQAIKAAKMAGLQNDGLDNAMRRTIDGFKKQQNKSEGYFGYVGPQFNKHVVRGHLTGAGVLGLQLMGAGDSEEVKRGLAWLDKDVTCDWVNHGGGNPIYYWYYITQAKFHAGGETWKNWNKQFAPQLVKNQTVVKGGGEDGKDIGYWKPAAPSEWSQSFSYNTTLCALMLQVYYRYLPTYKTPELMAAEQNADGQQDQKILEGQDIEIDIINNG